MTSWRLRDEQAKFLKAEREALDRMAAPILAQTQDAMRKAVAAQREAVTNFWSLPFADIERFGPQAAGAYDDLGLPTVEHTGEETAVRFTKRVFDEFLAGLTARTGYTLNTDGQTRFGSYAQVQILNSVAVTTENLQAMFARLAELGCFEANSELGYDPSLITIRPEPEPVQAAPEPTLADIETMDMRGRENEQRAKELVDQLATKQQLPLMRAWIQFMIDQYGVTITHAQCQMVLDMFRKNNWNFLDRRNYDKAKRQMVARFEFPESCLNEDERIEREIEAMDTAGMSFSERQRLSRRLEHVQSRKD
jgi:hypothetical protein